MCLMSTSCQVRKVTAHSARVCMCCQAEGAQDEHHFLFACAWYQNFDVCNKSEYSCVIGIWLFAHNVFWNYSDLALVACYT